MARTIHVRVVTNEGQVMADEAVSIQAPGEIGYLGILYNHAPLVTTLQPGKLTWRTPDGQTRAVRVDTGLLEITHNRFTLFTTAVSELSQPSHA